MSQKLGKLLKVMKDTPCAILPKLLAITIERTFYFEAYLESTKDFYHMDIPWVLVQTTKQLLKNQKINQKAICKGNSNG